ncbi:MAG: SdrD B-like domain-containing protein, partial [Syntrophothermus sp.]
TADNVPAPQVQSQPIILQNPPTQVVVAEATIALQAPAEEAAFDGLVWDDYNRNGLQDLNEPGLPNVTVSLFNSAKTGIGVTLSDGNGAYRFQHLVPGDYYLAVAAPVGYVFSPQNQGENELVDSDTDPVAALTSLVTLVAGENGLVWTTGVYSPTAAIQPDPGTVKPPPADIKVCVAGMYSLGGISTLQVKQLAMDYCLHAFLWKHGFAIGRIPGGAGRILADVTFIEFYYKDLLTYKYDVSGETDSIRVCYAVPVGKKAQIYFMDFYGPRFGQRTGQPSWVPLETTIQDGIACAVAQTSGAYALIGK